MPGICAHLFRALSVRLLIACHLPAALPDSILLHSIDMQKPRQNPARVCLCVRVRGL